jgi:hypothetical protein
MEGRENKSNRSKDNNRRLLVRGREARERLLTCVGEGMRNNLPIRERGNGKMELAEPHRPIRNDKDESNLILQNCSLPCLI